ncbi:hypothetical protein [Tistlia consotensis]|nr:hypothetical protein [Tistlia consotensis]
MTGRPDNLQDQFSREALSPSYLQAAYDFWCEARGSDALAPVEALDPTRLPLACLPYLGVVEVEPDPLRFRSRLTGTRVVEALGVDHTGCYLDEIPGMAPQIARIEWGVRERRPYLAESAVTFAPHDFRRYRTLTLSFGGEAGDVRRLLFVFAFLPPPGEQRA